MGTKKHSSSRSDVLFRKLINLIGKLPSNGTAETVHHLRTTIRRIETLLATSPDSDGRGKTRLQKQLARMRRHAGKLRDIDVQTEALKSLHLGALQTDRDAVAQALQQSRHKRERKLNKTIKKETDDGLKNRLKRALDQVAEANAGKNPADHTEAALSQFQTLAQQYHNLDEANLHNFRKACKHVRYLAELSGEERRAKKIVSALKRLQDATGSWHDWLTLAETAASALNNPHSPLISAIRAEQSAKLLQALHVSSDVREQLLAMQQAQQFANREGKHAPLPPRKGAGSVARDVVTNAA